MSFLSDTLSKQKRYVASVASHENICSINLWLNWLYCFVRYGATPSDWYCYELYKYRHNQLRKFITRRKNIELDRMFNPVEFQSHFNDKQVFNSVYRDFVKRRWLFVENGQLADYQLDKWGG